MRCRSLKGTMKDKRIIFTLIIVMSFIAMGGISITLYTLYQAAFAQQSERLRDTVQSRARIIESIARHTVEHYRLKHADTVSLDETAFKETLSQIIQAHGHFKGFGETGEFTLAKREADQIVFLLSHRHNDLENLKSIHISSEYAEPMRRALSGKSGTVVGLDYRGEIVLAGYEPVGVYGLGIVAKIDLTEIRTPFIEAATISIVLSCLLIFVGTFLFFRIGNPIIKRLTASEAALVEAQRISQVGSWEYDIAADKPKWSKQMFRIFHREEEKGALSWLERNQSIDPDDWKKWNAAVMAAIGEGKPCDLEFRIVAGKEIVWARGICTAIQDESGKVVNLQGTVQDITDSKRAERELQEREALLNEVGDIAKIGGWEIDLITRTGKWTKGTYNIAEIDSGDQVPGPDEHIAHYLPEFQSAAKEAMKKLIEDNIPMEFEAQLKTAKGNIKWCRAMGRGIRQDGKCVKMYGTFQDITERKQAEEALRESEAQKTAILNGITTNIALVDKELKILWANKEAANSVNKQPEDLLGHPCYSFWGDPAKPCANCPTLIAFQTKQSEHKTVQTLDGRIWEEGGEPVFDKEGNVTCVVEIARDITDRIKAEEALRNSETWLSTTLNSVGDAVITTDVEGKVSFLNPTAQALTGWKLGNAMGQSLTSVFNIINERTRETVENPATKVLREKKIVGLANHTVLISKDGIEHPIADSGAPIEDDEGNVLGVVLVFRDMSEARATEAQNRQRQKLEAIGTLAGGVAHEINNPVGIIMNNAELMLDDVEPGGDLEVNTREIIRESKRIAVIVRNLLAFSRQGKESHSPALLADIVESTLSLTRKVLEKDQIEVEVDIPDDLPKLKCRSQQIQQVLMNLVTNARYALNQRYPKYDKNKVIKITAQTFTRDDIAWIRVSVEDHGAGISPEIMDRIFDPFFTTKPRDEGTGLGLSISHGIVRDHQGELRAESKEGVYSRFHLELRVDNGWFLSPSGADDKEND